MASDLANTSSLSGTGFHTTRWSVVLAAQGRSSRDAFESLESLCGQYWRPLYACTRQRGHSVHDAQDLVQAFFAKLLEKDWLQAASQERGRFRSFLLMALKRFLANEWDHSSAQKRGGGERMVSLDTETALRMSIPDERQVSAETLFDRQWAIALLESVMRSLRDEYVKADRHEEYEALKPGLTAERGCVDYAALGAALSMEASSARSAVHRLRKRYRELFRAAVAETVATPGDVEDEMRAVIVALGASE